MPLSTLLASAVASVFADHFKSVIDSCLIKFLKLEAHSYFWRCEIFKRNEISVYVFRSH